MMQLSTATIYADRFIELLLSKKTLDKNDIIVLHSNLCKNIDKKEREIEKKMVLTLKTIDYLKKCSIH